MQQPYLRKCSLIFDAIVSHENIRTFPFYTHERLQTCVIIRHYLLRLRANICAADVSRGNEEEEE